MRLTPAYISISILALGLVKQEFSHAVEEPAEIQMGGFQFVPTIDVGIKYDDNLLRTDDSKLDTWSTIVTPRFLIKNQYGASDFSVGYQLKHERYASSGQDNYTDHLFWTDLHYDIHSRHRLMLNAEYEDGHDGRGTRYSIGRGAELLNPDTYRDTDASLIYGYGSNTAMARIDLQYRYLDVDYDGEGEDYLSRDRDTHILGATFYYRLGAQTDMVLDVSSAQISYDYTPEDAVSLDSREDKALIGVRWESTEATSGYAKVGMRRKVFDSNLRDDFDGLAWEMGVNWRPLTYSRFELSTASDIKETDGQGNFIEKRDYQLVWQHEWSGQFYSEFELLYQDDEYAGRSPLDDVLVPIREDSGWGSEVKANYVLKRWLLLSLGYRFEQRDSTRDILDFDRNVLSLNISASL